MGGEGGIRLSRWTLDRETIRLVPATFGSSSEPAARGSNPTRPAPDRTPLRFFATLIGGEGGI
jgi:hypothetical protein